MKKSPVDAGDFFWKIWPRSPRRPLGLDDNLSQAVTRHRRGLQRESDLAILSHPIDKGGGVAKEVAVGTVMP